MQNDPEKIDTEKMYIKYTKHKTDVWYSVGSL